MDIVLGEAQPVSSTCHVCFTPLPCVCHRDIVITTPVDKATLEMYSEDIDPVADDEYLELGDSCDEVFHAFISYQTETEGSLSRILYDQLERCPASARQFKWVWWSWPPPALPLDSFGAFWSLESTCGWPPGYHGEWPLPSLGSLTLHVR